MYGRAQTPTKFFFDFLFIGPLTDTKFEQQNRNNKRE